MKKELFLEEIFLQILDCLLRIEEDIRSNQLYTGVQNEIKKENQWIPVTKWNKKFEYPTLGAMKSIVLRRKENGADKFIKKINNRLYINAPKFHEWIENNTQYEKCPWLEKNP